MSVGWVAAGVALVGAVSAASSAEDQIDASNQQSASARAQADKQLDAQVRQADELLAFNKQQYEEGKTRQVGIDAINKQVVDQNLQLSQKAGERADDAYNFYKTTGRPVVEKSINDATNFDSQGNIDAARGRATGDVQQAFDNSAEQTQRALTRMGVNPSSGRFLALQQRLQADKAAALAGSATNAEQNVRDQAIGLRQQASNLAQGFPAQSIAQSGASTGAGVAAAGVAGAGGAQANAISTTALQGMASGANIYGNVAGGYTSLMNSASNNAANISNSASQSQAGWGNLIGTGLSLASRNYQPQPTYTIPSNPYGGYTGNTSGPVDGFGGGGFADGGKITGPGTGTSDSVKAVNQDNGQPIRLSNGEYVLSADTVKAVGTKYLDNLQAKHHKPVAGKNMRSVA